ncbi:MAG: hypothetical protein SGI83_13465 [Bacteroidota bacterium]|nr:hypothetical protein [Bacteroidota bacterium]
MKKGLLQILIQEQILRTTISRLTETDRLELSRKRNSQLLIIIGAWLLITALCFFIWKTGADSRNLDNKSFRVHFSSDNTETFRQAVPYICALVFLVTTFFFIKSLFRSILPLSKDIKKGEKWLLYYKPVKSSKPSTNNYYLSAPIREKQLLEISREDFADISEKEELCLEIATQSFHLLRLRKEQKIITYY